MKFKKMFLVAMSSAFVLGGATVTYAGDNFANEPTVFDIQFDTTNLGDQYSTGAVARFNNEVIPGGGTSSTVRVFNNVPGLSHTNARVNLRVTTTGWHNNPHLFLAFRDVNSGASSTVTLFVNNGTTNVLEEFRSVLSSFSGPVDIFLINNSLGTTMTVDGTVTLFH